MLTAGRERPRRLLHVPARLAPARAAARCGRGCRRCSPWPSRPGCSRSWGPGSSRCRSGSSRACSSRSTPRSPSTRRRPARPRSSPPSRCCRPGCCSAPSSGGQRWWVGYAVVCAVLVGLNLLALLVPGRPRRRAPALAPAPGPAPVGPGDRAGAAGRRRPGRRGRRPAVPDRLDPEAGDLLGAGLRPPGPRTQPRRRRPGGRPRARGGAAHPERAGPAAAGARAPPGRAAQRGPRARLVRPPDLRAALRVPLGRSGQPARGGGCRPPGPARSPPGPVVGRSPSGRRGRCSSWASVASGPSGWTGPRPRGPTTSPPPPASWPQEPGRATRCSSCRATAGSSRSSTRRPSPGCGTSGCPRPPSQADNLMGRRAPPARGPAEHRRQRPRLGPRAPGPRPAARRPGRAGRARPPAARLRRRPVHRAHGVGITLFVRRSATS